MKLVKLDGVARCGPMDQSEKAGRPSQLSIGLCFLLRSSTENIELVGYPIKILTSENKKCSKSHKKGPRLGHGPTRTGQDGLVLSRHFFSPTQSKTLDHRADSLGFAKIDSSNCGVMVI